MRDGLTLTGDPAAGADGGASGAQTAPDRGRVVNLPRKVAAAVAGATGAQRAELAAAGEGCGFGSSSELPADLARVTFTARVVCRGAVFEPGTRATLARVDANRLVGRGLARVEG